MAQEQFKFETQVEECHRRLLVGQVEAERRILELKAWVATLQNELAIQQQKMTAQRQHYEESLGKMETSYRLLQCRVDQDIQDIRAERTRIVEQQVQSLRDTLQKEVTKVMTAQLTPVHDEIAVLQT